MDPKNNLSGSKKPIFTKITPVGKIKQAPSGTANAGYAHAKKEGGYPLTGGKKK